MQTEEPYTVKKKKKQLKTMQEICQLYTKTFEHLWKSRNELKPTKKYRWNFKTGAKPKSSIFLNDKENCMWSIHRASIIQPLTSSVTFAKARPANVALPWPDMRGRLRRMETPCMEANRAAEGLESAFFPQLSSQSSSVLHLGFWLES